MIYELRGGGYLRSQREVCSRQPSPRATHRGVRQRTPRLATTGMRLAVLVISVTISVTALAGQHAAQEAAPAPELHTHGRALRMRRGRGGKGRGGRGRGAASLPPGSNATLPQERCKTGGRGVWDLPLHCRRKLPCDIRAFDPGAKYNRKIVQSQKKAWAKHNVDPANRHFQNGVEWWVQRGLPPAVTEPEQLRGAKHRQARHMDAHHTAARRRSLDA